MGEVVLARGGLAGEAAAAYYPRGFPPPEAAEPGLPVMGLVRIVLLTALAAGVAWVTHWVFADTQFVGTDRAVWSGEAMGVGLVALAVACLVPWLYVGLPLGAAMFGGAAVVYVVHRNARVTPPLEVKAPGHVAACIKEPVEGARPGTELAPR